MDLLPNHPILRPGITVQIGLDKNTKLNAVFTRYVLFCNQHGAPTPEQARVSVADLEFVHCHVLSGSMTAEAAALMKNDRITVRKEEETDRELMMELQRVQRESDKEFFLQLKQLGPNGSVPTKLCNVVLDCQGSLVDDDGRIQQVLSTSVRCHSAVVRQRCPWLGRMIDAASQERARRSIVSLPDAEMGAVAMAAAAAEDGADAAAALDHQVPVAEFKDSEDDDMEVLNYNARIHNRETRTSRAGAAQIENDEDDLKANVAAAVAAVPEGDDDSFSTVRSDSSILWVTLPNHSPDAAKLLLEYLYTNRVIPLGYIAFLQSCRNKPGRKTKGPVAPFAVGSSATRHWPNRGDPTVSFAAAMAALSLAEQASLPRLSLMCEIAAAQLISVTNVVDALSACQAQSEATGNPLPRLRKVAMNLVLRSGPRGVFVLPTFRKALEERSKSLIPTLLTGTMEAIDKAESKPKKGHHSADKRDWREKASDFFDSFDREDTHKRERERRKRRIERWEKDPARVADHVKFQEDLRDERKSGEWSGGRRGSKRSASRMEQRRVGPRPHARRRHKSSHK